MLRIRPYSNERLYLAQFPINSTPIILEPDVAGFPYIPEGSTFINKNLWFGPLGTITPFHFDRSHNLLHQHWGRKHVVMLDPSYFYLMKSGSKNSGMPHVSSLDFVTSDFDIDISQLAAPCFEVILEPGDVLFIPAYWWHHVIAMDVAVSINYWWRPPLSACLWPGFFRMISSGSVYYDPSVVINWVDLAPHKLDTALCLFLAEEGHTFGAAALAGAIVFAFCNKALRMLGFSDPSRSMREVEADTLPNFAQAARLIPAFTAQGLINGSQSNLLLKWLEFAEETAAEPEPREYTSERAAAIRFMISALHVELGRWIAE